MRTRRRRQLTTIRPDDTQTTSKKWMTVDVNDHHDRYQEGDTEKTDNSTQIYDSSWLTPITWVVWLKYMLPDHFLKVVSSGGRDSWQ